MSRAASAAALGVLLVAAAAAFDTPSLYLPGVALSALGLGSALWVGLAAAGSSVVRMPGPHTVEEEEVYPLRLELRPGVLPLPPVSWNIRSWASRSAWAWVSRAGCGSTCASRAGAGGSSGPERW